MPTPADLFRAMADRIEAMKPEEFAGAILIVPPDPPPELQGSFRNDPVSVLSIEDRPSLDHFWGAAKLRVEGAVNVFLEELRKRQSGMGFR